MSLKLSIALASLNGESYLEAQLRSFVAQTRQPDELVVTDDGSSDRTLEILNSFAATAPFKVIVHRNDRSLGYGGNFNQALLRTTGDLVFLSDQDDVWFPDKIERMAAVAAADLQALVFLNDAALTDADLNETGLTKLGQIRSAGFGEDTFVMGCCAAVKREWLDLCLPIPDGFRAHDNWIVGIAGAMGRKRIVPEVLQYYRRHGNNQSQWIVNRTTKVTRWHVELETWRHGLSKLIHRSGVTQPSAHAASPSPAWMVKWAQESAIRAPEPYASDLRRYAEILLRTEALWERRLGIRKQPFPQSAFAAARLWQQGGYAAFSGWKSAVRDAVLR